MNKLIKTMPLVAILLGAGIFTVNAAFNASQVLVDQEWVPSPSGDPTDPNDYTSAPSGTISDCNNTNGAVCAIVAPEDSANPGKPFFSQELQDALDSQSLDHPDIYEGPRTP